MKYFIAAFALAFAYPAAAQTAPAAGHDQHRQHPQGEHQGAGHEGQGEGRKHECCCKKMAEGQKMECCDKHGEGQAAQPSGHQGH